MKMEYPSPWLSFAIVIHGLIGSFTEQQTGLPQKYATPLANFYNSSVSAHYGMYLDDDGVTMAMTVVSNMMMVGSILSTLVFLPKMDSWGRKTVAVYVRSACAILAGLLMVLSKYLNSIELFLVSVFFIGSQKPLRIGATKMYISECAPDKLRGFSVEAVGTLSFVAALLPMMLAFESYFGNDSRWFWVGYMSLLWAVLYLFLAYLVPESPKMLKLKQAGDKKIDDAIRKYHGKNVDLDGVLYEYTREFELTKMSKHTSLFAVFKDSTLTNSLILVIVTCLIPSLSPNQIIQVNSIPLKIKFGFSNDAAIKFDFICGLLNLPFTFLMPVVIEKIGRRFVILFAIFCNVLSCLALFIGEWLLYSSVDPAVMAAETPTASIYTLVFGVVFSLADYAAHSAGVSLLFIILIADILPASAKATVSQFAFILNNLTTILTTELYSNLYPHLHAYTYLIFGAIQFFFVIYIYRNLPETRQKAVYENYEQVQQISEEPAMFKKFSVVSGPIPTTFQRSKKTSIVPLLNPSNDKVYGSINV